MESDAPYVDVLALSKMTGAEMAFELPHFFHVVFTLGVGITHGAITREGNFELTYEGQLDQMYQTAKDVSEFSPWTQQDTMLESLALEPTKFGYWKRAKLWEMHLRFVKVV